jgi:hypothetical protein
MTGFDEVVNVQRRKFGYLQKHTIGLRFLEILTARKAVLQV